MSSILRNKLVALGVAGAIVLGSVATTAPAFAGPVPANTAAAKQAATGDVIDVRHRGWHRGPGPWVAGAALGVIGAIIANEAYRDRYYDGYYYGPYPYAAPYPGQQYYYGGYAPYRGYTTRGACIDRPEAC